MSGSDWRDDPRYAKGCTCFDHSVPHWLWMDRMDRQRVRDLITVARRAQMVFESKPTWLNRQAVLTAVAGVAAVDRPRIAEKIANMRRLGIRELPHDLLSQIENEWAQPRTPALPPPPKPEPMSTQEADELRARVRQTAMSLEMATSPKEAERLRVELDDLDRRLRVGVIRKETTHETPAAPLRESVMPFDFRRKNGQYDASKMDRLCVCGHSLGLHNAEQPRECLSGQCGDDAPVCGCAKFKAAKQKSP